MKRRWIAWLGIILSVISIVYFSWDLNPTEVRRALAAADLRWLALSTVIFCISVILRGPRWRVLGREVCLAGHANYTASLLVGFLANRVLPGRVGEFIRCLVLSRKTGAPLSGLLASVAVEKAIDLLAVGTLTALVLVWWSASDVEAQSGSLIRALANKRDWLLLMGLVGLVGLSLLAWWPAAVMAAVQGFSKRHPGRLSQFLERVSHAVLDGLATLRSLPMMLLALGYTVVIWLLVAISEAYAIWAFSPEQPLLAAFALTVVIAVGVAVPQAPSYVGVFWVVVDKTLHLGFGMEQQEAKALALALWFVQIIPIALVGLVCLWWLGPSIGGMRGVTRWRNHTQAK